MAPLPRLLRRGAALPALAAAALSLLAPHPAEAFLITVNSKPYQVSTFYGTYSGNSTKFSTALMPWWNSTLLTSQFTDAIFTAGGSPTNRFVGQSFPDSLYPFGTSNGLPNLIYDSSAPAPEPLVWGSPLLAYKVDSGNVKFNAVFQGTSEEIVDGDTPYPVPTGTAQLLVAGYEVIGDNFDQYWITATEVPAPLPALGAGAAFAWSRRLRRRVAARPSLTRG